MKKIAWVLTGVLAISPLAVANATDPPATGKAESAAQEKAQEKAEVAQQKDECKQAEQQKGTGEKTSAVVCVIKVIFQSRIRRRKDTEPVEMTVGSPPMQTDDTGTPGPNNWEINIGLEGELAGSERTLEAPKLDINYGVGDRVQLTYEVPYIWARQQVFIGAGGTDPLGNMRLVDVHGVGDSALSVKYRFYDNKDTGLSFAVFPQVVFHTPGGKRALSEGTTFHLPVVVTKEFEHVAIGGNLGVDISGGDKRYFATFGLGTRLSDHVALLAEIVGNNLNATDEKHVLLNFGLRRKIDDTQSISGSLGHDVYAGGDQREHTYFNVTYQKLFGK